MNYIKIAIIIFSMLSIVACDDTETIEFIETKTAIVEGYLYADQSVDSIKITQSFSYAQLDSNVITLDNLNVTLSDDVNQYTLNSIGNGIYQNTTILIEEDKSYRLEFEWLDKTVVAETYIPIKKEGQLSLDEVELPKILLNSFPNITSGTQDPVEISWDNSENDYYFIVIKNIETNPEYINENIEETITANGGTPQFVFTTEPQITNVYTINSRRVLTQYGTHQIIIYRVNPEYAALYESSGSSTLSLEQPPTNIENGLGIFTGVSSDTLYLEVKKI